MPMTCLWWQGIHDQGGPSINANSRGGVAVANGVPTNLVMNIHVVPAPSHSNGHGMNLGVSVLHRHARFRMTGEDVAINAMRSVFGAIVRE